MRLRKHDWQGLHLHQQLHRRHQRPPPPQYHSHQTELDIRAILSVARSGRLDHPKEDIPLYLYIPAQDHADYELYRHFNQTFEFIDAARRETNVLVHCMAGVSRSVTIVMAYLLKKYKCSLSEVIKMVQRKRHKVHIP